MDVLMEIFKVLTLNEWGHIRLLTIDGKKEQTDKYKTLSKCMTAASSKLHTIMVRSFSLPVPTSHILQ